MVMTTYQRVSDQRSTGIKQQLILSDLPVNSRRSVQTADEKEMQMAVWQINAAKQCHTEILVY